MSNRIWDHPLSLSDSQNGSVAIPAIPAIRPVTGQGESPHRHTSAIVWFMGDSSTKAGDETVALDRDQRGRFAVGRAGGPGRKPRGQTLAERARRIADPDELIEFLVSVVRSTKEKTTDRLAAAREVLDRGWGKALATVEITRGDADEHTFGHLSDDELRLELERLDRLAAGDRRLPEPRVFDEDEHSAHRLPTDGALPGEPNPAESLTRTTEPA